MKLWHDDVRPAPNGWVWARTNDEAKDYLLSGEVVEISMDHDLGYHDVVLPDNNPDDLAEVLLLKGQAEETGLDLAKWMVEYNIVPTHITIHSWNPSGARAMYQILADTAAKSVYIKPFEVTK